MNAAQPISEAQFLEAIRDLRRKVPAAAQWRIAHFRPAWTGHGPRTPVALDGKGFPDLVLCHPARKLVLFREVKADRGVLSDEQADWINDLNAAGADAGIWHTRNLRDIHTFLIDGQGKVA